MFPECPMKKKKRKWGVFNIRNFCLSLICISGCCGMLCESSAGCWRCWFVNNILWADLFTYRYKSFVKFSGCRMAGPQAWCIHLQDALIYVSAPISSIYIYMKIHKNLHLSVMQNTLNKPFPSVVLWRGFDEKSFSYLVQLQANFHSYDCADSSQISSAVMCVCVLYCWSLLCFVFEKSDLI